MCYAGQLPDLLQVRRLLVVGHVKELRLERAAEGHNGLPAMLLDPLKDLRTNPGPVSICYFRSSMPAPQCWLL